MKKLVLWVEGKTDAFLLHVVKSKWSFVWLSAIFFGGYLFGWYEGHQAGVQDIVTRMEMTSPVQ